MFAVVAVKKRLPGVLLSQWLLLVGLFGLALALGLYRIGSKSIWFDEAVSVQYARADLSALAKYVSSDANGALYYFLLHWWIGFVGYGEAAVRSFSAVFAAGSVPLLYLIARRWLDPVAAVAASLLFATSQMFIDYAQDAHMYALALFLVLAATLVLQIAVERRSMRWWWLYALVAVLAPYAHLWTALVLLAHAIWLVTCERAHLRRALVVSPVVIALSLPMIVYAVIRSPAMARWIGPLSESQIFSTLLALAGGSWPLFVVAGQAILRVGWLARTGRREYVLPLLMGVVPIVATIAISLVKPMLISRYLFFAVPSLAVVCVIAAFSLKPRGVAVLAAAWLVAVSATTGAWWYTRAPLQDYRGATLAVTVRAQAGDVVLLNPGYLWPGYDYYIDRLGLAGKPPAKTGQWQIEQAWPRVVWIISEPARDADIAPFVQTLKQHGYKVDGPPVAVKDFVIRRYVRPKA